MATFLFCDIVIVCPESQGFGAPPPRTLACLAPAATLDAMACILDDAEADDMEEIHACSRAC